MSAGATLIPTIRPSSVIRTDYKAFSQLVHEAAEPVVVTNNGEADLIVMSPEAYNMREARLSLEQKLLEGDRDIAEGRLVDHKTVMEELRMRLERAV